MTAIDEGKFAAKTKLLDDRNARIEQLTDELAAHRSQIDSLRSNLNSLLSQHNSTAEALRQAHEQIETIQRSRGYRALQLWYRFRLALVPKGSTAERFLLSLFRLLRHGAATTPVSGLAHNEPIVDSPPPEGPTQIQTFSQTTAVAGEQTGPSPEGHAPAEMYRARVRRCAVIVLPIIDWAFRFQRPQQISRELARAGHQVFYVSTGFSPAPGRSEIEPGIVGLTLAGPTSLNLYRDNLDATNADLLAKALAIEVRRAGVGAAVILCQLPFWRTLAQHLRDKLFAPVIYDCMDDHAGFSTNSPMMLAEEGRLLASADLVVASSQGLFDRLKPRARRIELVRNAADYPHFAAVIDRAGGKDEPLTVGYYGAIADWFDSALMAEISRLRPQWRFVLVGDTHTGDTEPLRSQSNVELAGEQPYARLPEWLSSWDCCLIPFKRNPLTDATDPVKVYEMLAAGRPIVAVPMPELVPLAQLGLLSLASSAAEFANAIERLVSSDDPVKRARRREFAALNQWRHRREALQKQLELLFPLVSIVVVTFNNRQLTELCLASVLDDTDYPNFEVIVVDNASRDNTPPYLKELAATDARIKLVLNADNRGFAAACNQGVAASKGEYLCLLNNDTVVTGAWLSTLVGHLRRDSTLGLLGPVTNSIGNEAQITAGYEYLADMPAWVQLYRWQHIDRLTEIPMLAFFCVATRRTVWDKVGPLDERFAVGMFEDDDWNRRVRQAGYKVRLARDSFVHHWHNASLRLLSRPAYQRIYFDNRRRFRQKWNELPEPPVTAQRQIAELIRTAEQVKLTAFLPILGKGAPANAAKRRHGLWRAFQELGLGVILEYERESDNAAVVRELEPRVFEYRGERDWLVDVPRMFVWADCSNLDARDHFPPGTPAIFDWVAPFAEYSDDPRRAEWLLWRGVEEAEVFAAATWDLAKTIATRRKDVLLLPDAFEAGTDQSHATDLKSQAAVRVQALRDLGQPVIGYCGPLTEWVNYRLLLDVAQAHPEWQFVLLGFDIDGSLWRAQLSSTQNIHWITPKDDTDAIQVARFFDVAVFPLNSIGDEPTLPRPTLCELLASGIPVVTSPTQQLAPVVARPGTRDPHEFAVAIDAALNERRSGTLQAGIDALLARQTWLARAQYVLAVLDHAPAKLLAAEQIMTAGSPSR